MNLSKGKARALSELDAQHPWPGLEAFRESDQEFFRGRSSEALTLARRVELQRLTVLYGKSGVGKTSLLLAGLFPRLRELDFLPIHIRLSHDQGAPPLEQQILGAILEEGERSRVEVPSFDYESLWESLHRVDCEFWSHRNRLLQPVLVFDQFEEIFVRRARGPAREFYATLGGLIEGEAPVGLGPKLDGDSERRKMLDFTRHNYRVVIGIREDFLARLGELGEHIPTVSNTRSWFPLHRMSGDRALSVVTGPGRMVIREPVAKKIVRFVAKEEGEPGPLEELEVEPALLSLVCRELNFRRLESGQDLITGDLVTTRYEEILRGFYEQSFVDMPSKVRAFVEQRLVTASGFRNSEAWDNAVQTAGVAPEQLHELIIRRLIRVEETSLGRRIELIHDLLAKVAVASRQRRKDELERREAELERLRARQERILVSAPEEPVFYYECSAGRFRLVYFIPPQTLLFLRDLDQISDQAIEDLPDGVDLGCTEPDFAEFEELYGYRPPMAPDKLQHAFFAILSTTRNWQTFCGAGFIPAKDLEWQVEAVAQVLDSLDLSSPTVEPFSGRTGPRQRRKKRHDHEERQTRVQDALRKMRAEGVDSDRTLREQQFSMHTVSEGKPAEQVFSELFQRQKR